jgi:RNA polymerase sigma-70 factor, ECF subfamily
MSPETAIDDDLIASFVRGDEASFVQIVGRYREKITAVAFGLLRNRADADEIAQDTFIRAHRGLATFRGESSLSTWLFRIATNLARNRYWYFFRRRKQDTLSLDCDLGTESPGTFSDRVADTGQDPSQQTATAEFCVLVERGMQRLAVHHRHILTMRNVQNRSYEEIGTALGINVGTVKSRIARARENLRGLLAAMCPEFSPDAAPSAWFLPKRVTHGTLAVSAA